jgi:putative heme-binding domain-containing protein
MATLATVLDVIDREGKSLAAIADAETHRSISRMVTEARAVAVSPQADLEDRVTAVTLLVRDAADRDVLAGLLTAQQPAALQAAAAVALARAPGDKSSDVLAAGWAGYSPALKSQILNLLLSRPGGAARLLTAIEKNNIPAGQIDAARRQRLLSHREPAVRERAERLFAAAGNPDRQKVLTAYQDVLKQTGDIAHGRAVFAKSCSVCHRLDNVGHEVGPDLAQLQNKSPAYLLQEILDPNRNVDSRFVEYRAMTKAGRDYSGLLHAESATSVTLRAQDGREQVLLRGEIESLDSTGRSLMPDGLEKDLSRQDLADLLAYITGPRGTPIKSGSR